MRRSHWPGLVAVGCVVAAVVWYLGSISPPDVWLVLHLGVGGAAAGVVGTVISRSHPRLLTGWLFIGFSLSAAGYLLVATLRVETGQGWGTLPNSLLVAVSLGLLLTFPSGRLPSSRWRWVGYWLWLMVVMSVVGAAFPEASDPAYGFYFVSIVVIGAAAAARIVVAYWKGDDLVRRQFKWLALVLILGGLLLVVSLIELPVITELHNVAGLFLLTGFPVAVGLAVLRYRLYEIDRIISRTVSYALVVGVSVSVFFGVVALATTLVPAQSDLAVAGSTLVVAALFNPLRRRVQGLVDRRFNRSRYDAERVVAGFTGSLRDTIDADGVVDGWMEVVADTMQPSSVGVWVRR